MFGISYIRLAAYAVLAIVIGYLIYQYRTGQEAKAQVATITAERDKVIADHNAYIATRAAQDSITAKVSTDYENAVTDLVGQLNAARSAIPVISVHHCANQNTSPTTTTRPDAASQNGPDRPHDEVVEVSTDEPLSIASEAATCGKRLNALQDWIRQQNSLTEPR